MHRDKKVCPSKPLNAREFENAIIDKIKELSQDRGQLKETLKNANLVAQKELEPLREKKILLEKAKREKGSLRCNYWERHYRRFGKQNS